MGAFLVVLARSFIGLKAFGLFTPMLVALAFLTRFVLQYTVAMAGFWQERVHALDLVIELPFLFLSGVLFPLEVLFESEHALMRAVGEVAMATPFPYMLWLPAQVFAGAEFTAAEVVGGLPCCRRGSWASRL